MSILMHTRRASLVMASSLLGLRNSGIHHEEAINYEASAVTCDIMPRANCLRSRTANIYLVKACRLLLRLKWLG
jgi:hypothetical protein